MAHLFVLGLTLCSSLTLALASRHLVNIEEESWKDILIGEWMIEFYAPWCPACKDLSKAWSAFADWSKDLDIKVAEIDVTKNPGLSGRFLVTALPTIFHIKDGVFRQYTGSRDRDDFISFIEEKKWATVEPIPKWRNPDSVQMGVVANFFKLSMTVRDGHNYLVEKKGVPAGASYAIFAIATLLLGCILGFFIVCIIDAVFPSTVKGAKKGSKDQDAKKKSSTPGKEKSKKEEKDESVSNGEMKSGDSKKKK